ncbi:MAG: hypothetical protein A3G41_01390, partial [Elusimicrobia bacterium RIFCSPLOWO2_12_FULL_59_9]
MPPSRLPSLAALLLGFSACGGPGARLLPLSRSLELTETVRLSVPLGKKSLRLWIPRPPSDSFQTAELLEVDSPWPRQDDADPDFNNQILYFDSRSPDPGAAEIRIKYRITRTEQTQPDPRGEPSLFQTPRGLVIVNDDIRRISAETARGLEGTTAKARALYHYVLGHVDYDTSGEGWGRGDVVYACRTGKGNCTDFHSLFIALALAQGIPARFQIGYPLPEAAEGTVLKPYHCWAEFFDAGRGWIPVDISEAWKRPAKADYYFGRLDPDRVLVSTGRDIRLPRRTGPALNYLVRPYAEADGKTF